MDKFSSFLFRAWNLHDIYQKRETKTSYGTPKTLGHFYGDAKEVRSGGIVRVWQNPNSSSLHFSVNGLDQGIAVKQIPEFLYGFVRVASRGTPGTIRITTFPG